MVGAHPCVNVILEVAGRDETGTISFERPATVPTTYLHALLSDRSPLLVMPRDFKPSSRGRLVLPLCAVRESNPQPTD